MSPPSKPNIFLVVTFALGIRDCAREFASKNYADSQVTIIERDTGCKVALGSPGSLHNCTPFNISNNEDNRTAWICCEEKSK